MLIMLLIIILSSVFGMFFASSFLFRRKMQENISASRDDVLDQIATRITLIQKSMAGLSNLYESSIMKYVLDKPTVADSDISMLMANMNSVELTYKNAMNIIDVPFHTVLVGDNGLLFVTGHDEKVYDYASLHRKKWFQEIPTENGDFFWTRTHSETDNGEFFVSLARAVYTEKGKRGILLISVAESSIASTFENVINGTNHIYIVDQTGKIISEDRSAYIGQFYDHFDDLKNSNGDRDYLIINKDGRDYLVSSYEDPDFGWNYIEEISMDEIQISGKDITKMVFAIAILVSILAFIMLTFLVRMTAEPIMRLSEKLGLVSQGNFETEFDVSGWQEITYINEVAAKMERQISELIMNIKKEERLKRKAEMKNLRMQINPHFMYNTLFSIKCMVGLEENEKAENMIGAFIIMLREALDNDEQLILLREELAIVDQYLILLKYRFGEGFMVKYDIEPEAEKCCVLKMIMQPIIENSVTHGLEPQGGKGTIMIRARIVQQDLILEISDNGVGMSDEKLEDENRRLRDNSSESGGTGNIGNKNVNQRIVINYGKRYGLHLKTNEQGGVTTVVVLPVIYS